MKEIVKKLLDDPFFWGVRDLTISELLEKEKDLSSTNLLLELTLHPEFQDSDLEKRLVDFENTIEKDSPWLPLAKWFEECAFYEPAEMYRLKFASDCLFSAVESELKEGFKSKLEAIWSDRRKLALKFLTSDKVRFDWSEATKSWLEGAHERYADWLHQRPPIATMLTSLRYFLSVSDKDNYQPTILDAGIFVLFFGSLAVPESTDAIGLQMGEEATQLGLMLLELHGERVGINLRKTISKEEYQFLKQRVEQVLKLLKKIPKNNMVEMQAA